MYGGLIRFSLLVLMLNINKKWIIKIVNIVTHINTSRITVLREFVKFINVLCIYF